MVLKNKKNKKSSGIDWGKLFGFTARERRAVLMLLPLIAVLAWILWSAARPKFDGSAEVIGNGLAGERYDANPQKTTGAMSADLTENALFDFDPNTVTYEELRKMGIPSGAAAGIIKYRQRGKVFQIAEDFATCYGITDSLYAALKPHIIIGEEYCLRPFTKDGDREKAESVPADKRVDKDGYGNSRSYNGADVPLVPFDPNEYTAGDFEKLGFSRRQAEVIIKFRDTKGGFRKAEELSECYVVSPEKYDQIKKFIIIAPVNDESGNTVKARTPNEKTELNSADSSGLVAIRGIGPRSASSIIAYRERLGGFHSIEQLAEIQEVTEKNYELIRTQIYVDSFKIRKIDINFALPNAVSGHPYISGKKLRGILRNRQLKGGWSTIEEMVEDNTLTLEEAAKLAPYLQFTMSPTQE